MALVHSLWTDPMLNNVRGQASTKQILSTIWCYASSVAYSRRNGEPINLYADEYGRKLLGFLPYDNIYNLEVPEEVPTEFWAAGKFYALQKMQLGDIHIDGDVFLKTTELMNVIYRGFSQADVIVQSVENSWVYDNDYYIKCLEVINDNKIILPNELPDYSPAFNCGLVGFNNSELKQQYLEHYFNSVALISKNEKAMNQIRKDSETWLDLVLEQQHLFSLVTKNEYIVCNLLGEGDSVYINAHILKYQHLIGSEKWDKIEQVKIQLKRLDREIYDSVINHLEKLEI